MGEKITFGLLNLGKNKDLRVLESRELRKALGPEVEAEILL